MAAPITSARSHAAIAISHSSHSTIVDRPRVAVAARLREVASAGDAEPRGQRLQQDRHQVRQHDHAEQRVAEPRAAGEVGRPVPGVHVADGDEVAGAGKGEQLAPEAGADGNRHGAVDFRQADGARRQTPSTCGCRRGFWQHRVLFLTTQKFNMSQAESDHATTRISAYLTLTPRGPAGNAFSR